jgi:hypothetical protein
MPVNIQIKDGHVKDLVLFYVERQKFLKAQINMLEKEVKEISAIIMQLRQAERTEGATEITPLANADVYDDKWPWVRKITFAMEQVNRPVSTREIVDILTEYEPEFIADRKRAIASVSSTLSVKAGEEFEKKQGTRGEFEYSLPGKDNYISNDTQSYGTSIGVDDLPF